MKKPRALACIHSAVSDTIFSRIMPYKTPKLAWNKIREEFDGGTRSRRTKLLKLKAKFVTLRMREDETVRQYASKLMEVVNKIGLLEENFPDSWVVEQIIISLPARFESKISMLEELNDTDSITAAELINKLESQEQRANIRETNYIKGALFIRAKAGTENKGKQTGEKSSTGRQQGNQNRGKQAKFPPCKICNLTNHLEKDCRTRTRRRSSAISVKSLATRKETVG